MISSSCHSLPGSSATGSLELTSNGAVYAYADANCTEGQFAVPVGIDNCYDYPAGLGSFKVVNA